MTMPKGSANAACAGCVASRKAGEPSPVRVVTRAFQPNGVGGRRVAHRRRKAMKAIELPRMTRSITARMALRVASRRIEFTLVNLRSHLNGTGEAQAHWRVDNQVLVLLLLRLGQIARDSITVNWE